MLFDSSMSLLMVPATSSMDKSSIAVPENDYQFDMKFFIKKKRSANKLHLDKTYLQAKLGTSCWFRTLASAFTVGISGFTEQNIFWCLHQLPRCKNLFSQNLHLKGPELVCIPPRRTWDPTGTEAGFDDGISWLCCTCALLPESQFCTKE